MDPEHDLWKQAAASDAALRWRLVTTNLAGASVVLIESWVLGLPPAMRNAQHAAAITSLVMIVYVGSALAVELLLSRRRTNRTFGWVDERRQPTAAEVTAVMDFPLTQSRWIVRWWLGGALACLAVTLATGSNVAYALRVVLDIALGGLTAAALSFLVLERWNRPVFTIALAGEATPNLSRIRLQRRLLLTWALGAAVPVAVIVSAPAGLPPARRAALAVPVLATGAMALLAGLVLTVAAARSITEPIEGLRAAQRRVEDGDLAVEVAVDDGGEVGTLQAGFNRMVSGLRERQRIRDLFGRHVGAEVARRAMEQGVNFGGELRHASILFVDLIGSTATAQRLPPDAVVAMLNQYLSAVVRAAGGEGGWVNKFEGDGAMCVFGAPAGDADHAAHALRAARALHRALAVLAADQAGFDAGIGVSTGAVVAGNVGAEDRYEYTVIGDPVNEAARLTEQAKQSPGRVLASGSSVAAAGQEADFWAPRGSLVLRGRSQPTAVFAPTDE